MTSGQRKVRLLPALLIAGAAFSVIPSVSAAYPGCGRSTVARDYLAEVKRVAPVREVPGSGQPSFSPVDLRLEATGVGVVVGSSQIGFHLSNPPSARHRLDWIVESELVKVTARGKEIQHLGIKRRSIGVVQRAVSRGFLHRVSAAPAYYRVDIRFRRKDSGHLLGQYSSYARVMKPRVDLRVKIDSPTVAPGEVAKATLLNLGTVPLVTSSYDFGFGVQAFTGERWLGVPDNPTRLIPRRRGPWTLPAGMENRGCLRYLVPSDRLSDLFRFVGFGAAAQAETVAAEFQVVSPS